MLVYEIFNAQRTNVNKKTNVRSIHVLSVDVTYPKNLFKL